MFKVINKVFFYFKIFFLLIAFAFTLYISFMKMDFASSNLLAVLPIFIPFLILLTLYVLSIFMEWKENKLFYNLASMLAFLATSIISFRTVFDKNIIAYPATININFFNAHEGRIKLLLYLMIIGNICLMYYQKRKKTDVVKIKQI